MVVARLVVFPDDLEKAHAEQKKVEAEAKKEFEDLEKLKEETKELEASL